MKENNTNNINNNIGTVISKYTGNEREVVIPDGVKRIEDGAFKDNKDIVSVVMPITLEYLGDEAFSGCTSLKRCMIHPNASVESIGKAAFKGCTALEELSQGYVKIIGDEAFMDCTALKELIVNSRCEKIGSSAFRNCTSLEYIVAPESLRKIGGDAFANCTKLKDVFIPMIDNIDDAFNKYFNGCTSLERRLRLKNEPQLECVPGVVENDTLVQFDDTYTDCLTIPSYIKNIAAGAFKDCRNLRLINIPDTVEDIDEGAFCGCTNLEDVIIPDDSDIVTDYMLEDTKWYRDNKDGFFVLGGTLIGYNKDLKDITIPPTVKRIEDDVVADLLNFRSNSISLPSTIINMPDIPNEKPTDPIVCVYRVVPGSAVL